MNYIFMWNFGDRYNIYIHKQLFNASIKVFIAGCLLHLPPFWKCSKNVDKAHQNFAEHEETLQIVALGLLQIT